jgi:hypothetical protein
MNVSRLEENRLGRAVISSLMKDDGYGAEETISQRVINLSLYLAGLPGPSL